MNLEYLRTLATDRVREQRRSDPHAKLSGAQLQIAREHGFPSWPRMKAYLDRRSAHPDGIQSAYRADLQYYEDRAYGLRESARDATPGAVAAFARHDAPLTQSGARLVVARAHGFPSWSALRRHAQAARERRAVLSRLLRRRVARSRWAARGVAPLARGGAHGGHERQRPAWHGDEHLRRADGRLLLEHGADPSHANAHGWTALHQVGYANAVHLLAPLLAAGAYTDAFARGDGGTPLVAALFWGHRDVADLLADVGAEPRNLRVAAGIGDAQLIDELAGTARAGAHRGFYRPHSGFPAWRPSDDPQEVLDEALAYAARSGRTHVLEMLVDHGARLEADVYRGTALIWAASRGRSAAVERLLELGADPMGRGDFGGDSHGRQVTALHLAASSGDAATVRILLQAGADATALDGHGYGTPASWARHDGHDDIAELIDGRV